MNYAFQNSATEWSFSSAKTYRDPFNEVDVDVIVESPDGSELRVPAFWAGEQTWRVRFASPIVGTHSYRSVCSDEGNSDLHGQKGVLEVRSYEGSNPLLSHGPLRISADHRHLEHQDGTPFFWLGDTWWMSLCRRLSWPGGFQTLTADRVAKGFSVIQMVAGLYPDMPPFDERGRLPLGGGLRSYPSRLLRHGGPQDRLPRAVGSGALYSRLLGLLPAVDGHGENEAALAQPGGTLWRIPGGLVPGR